ncbi:MAG: polyphosphate polymerase domain-containing protein [Lachnospiraceae bacterium]|nr:polyphosphate polymerase domain-containing protein [Lachnospiraceae bacterium]
MTAKKANAPGSNIFERSEIKYLVNDFQRAALLSAMKNILEPDPHGESTICNIYYDTHDFRLIRRSLEKPVYKEKLRIRSYGPASEDQKIFLELKKKYKGVVYKRRISLPLKEAEAFLAGKTSLADNDESYSKRQIGRELEYFRDFYGTLEPAVHLCYDRSAYFSKDDPNFRITFDRNIRWETENLSLTAEPAGQQILPAGQSIMEIKVAGSLPLEVVRILERLHIRKVSLSKYGRAYETMLADPESRAYESTRNIRLFPVCAPEEKGLTAAQGGAEPAGRRRRKIFSA